MIYLAILILVLILSYVYDFKNYGKYASFWYKLLIVVFIAVSGFRYKVGGDTLAYFEFFENYPFISELSSYNFLYSRFDPFWVILSSILKSIVNDFAFFQILHAIIINSIIFKFFKSNTKYVFTSILIYFLIFYLYFNTEIMRESLAICVFLLAYPYFKSKRWIKYYLCSLIAFLFHSSAIIIFLFPFFRNLNLTFINIFLISFVVLLLYIILIYYPEGLEKLLITERLSTRFETYTERKSNIFGQIYYFILYGMFPFIIFWLDKKLNNNDQLFQGLHLIYFFLVAVFIAISGLGRILNYIIPFMIVFYANFLNTFYKRRVFYNLSGPIIFLLILLPFIPKFWYYSEDTSRYSPGTHKYNLYYPYSSIFFKNEYSYREEIFRGIQRESFIK